MFLLTIFYYVMTDSVSFFKFKPESSTTIHRKVKWWHLRFFVREHSL
jgi:hypothetical protein